VEHYVRECKETIEWFTVLKKDKEEMEGCKGKVLRRLWKEKKIRSKIKDNEEGKSQGFIYIYRE